jgi:hypothetical protein
MELQFTAQNHKYQSINDPDKKWLSATSVIGLFKPKFDKLAQAQKSAANKKSKWYGMSIDDIIDTWDTENKRAVDLGSWYHDQREKELIACDTVQREGINLPIIRPIEQDGVKLSPDQNLTPGIYPEHLVYLKSARICGQADRIEVVGNKVNIYDYKTNKEIKLKGYTSWEGITNMMTGPLNHLEDCNFNHYAIQMSLYMYITLKHNHSLQPGKMQIHHIIFEVEGEDDFGYPIVAYDPMGDPIVKDVIPYDVPYLKNEVNNIIKYLKLHPEAYDK